ncbi:MAG: DnaB-like helicase C-terminal domain-containing protein [Nitrososphaerales archaeon]
MTELSNVASERAVLAGIAKYGIDAYADVESLLEEQTFTVEMNKIIYKCLQNSLKTSNTIDFSSILSSANDLKLYEYIQEKDGLKHINAILQTPINLDNVKEHAVKARRLQFGRETQEALRKSFKNVNGINGSENINSILSLAEGPLEEASIKYLKNENNRPIAISNSLDDYIQHVIDNPCDQIGLTTGLPGYDYVIGGGPRRKGLDIIGSRMKVGKSTIADCIALHVAGKNQIPVLMLDSEMGEEDHYERLLANLSSVETTEIGTGKFGKDKNKLDRVFKARDFLRQTPYHYMSIAGRKFDEILSIIRRWVLKEVGYSEGRLRDCLIIYDYLKLNTDSDIKNQSLQEYQLLGFQTTKLKDLAIQYDFPCITFVQVNRDGITQESSNIIGGSDRIGQYCSSFCLFKPKSEEEIATDGIMAGNRKMVPVFVRHGPGAEGCGYICLQMDGKFARIKHLGTIREVEKNDKSGYRKTESKTEGID